MLAGKNLILNYYINQTMLNKLKKYSIYGVLPLAALALLATNTVSAHGFGWGRNVDPDELATHQQEMFQEQADLLGTNVDTVKNAWAQGKNMKELAQELGLNETDLQAKMKAVRQAEMKSHLQTLVTKGVITQAQADQRYTFMEQHMANEPAWLGMGMGRGGRHGGGLGGFGQ